MDKRNNWTEKEITILKEKYSKGLNVVMELIPRHTRSAIQKKSKRLKLSVDKENLYYDIDEIENVVKDSISYAEVFRKLNKSKSGDSYKSLKNFINRNDIDTSHFNPWQNNRVKNTGKPIDFWLQKGSSMGSTNLKEKLYKEGLKERKCELCGQDENWNGKKMSLILDHINGVNNDNRIENLRIVCPNCNATLDTHGGKNIKVKKKKYYCSCGNEKSKVADKCRKCDSIKQRRTNRPDKETLLKEIEELGYIGTGRKYGVSDNAIRKWIK
jgi:hypothetical protein